LYSCGLTLGLATSTVAFLDHPRGRAGICLLRIWRLLIYLVYPPQDNPRPQVSPLLVGPISQENEVSRLLYSLTCHTRFPPTLPVLFLYIFRDSWKMPPCLRLSSRPS
jgi:hypothetical protein